MNLPNRTSRNRKNRNGVTAVELAISIPWFLLLVFIFIEMAHAMMVASVVENAAFEGARRSIIPGATLEASRQVASNVAIASGLNSVVVEVAVTAASPRVDAITISVAAPMNENSILAGLILGDATISRSATMIHESDLRYLHIPEPRPLVPPTPKPRGRGDAVR